MQSLNCSAYYHSNSHYFGSVKGPELESACSGPIPAYVEAAVEAASGLFGLDRLTTKALE